MAQEQQFKDYILPGVIQACIFLIGLLINLPVLLVSIIILTIDEARAGYLSDTLVKVATVLLDLSAFPGIAFGVLILFNIVYYGCVVPVKMCRAYASHQSDTQEPPADMHLNHEYIFYFGLGVGIIVSYVFLIIVVIDQAFTGYFSDTFRTVAVMLACSGVAVGLVVVWILCNILYRCFVFSKVCFSKCSKAREQGEVEPPSYDDNASGEQGEVELPSYDSGSDGRGEV